MRPINTRGFISRSGSGRGQAAKDEGPLDIRERGYWEDRLAKSNGRQMRASRGPFPRRRVTSLGSFSHLLKNNIVNLSHDARTITISALPIYSLRFVRVQCVVQMIRLGTVVRSDAWSSKESLRDSGELCNDLEERRALLECAGPCEILRESGGKKGGRGFSSWGEFFLQDQWFDENCKDRDFERGSEQRFLYSNYQLF